MREGGKDYLYNHGKPPNDHFTLSSLHWTGYEFKMTLLRYIDEENVSKGKIDLETDLIE